MLLGSVNFRVKACFILVLEFKSRFIFIKLSNIKLLQMARHQRIRVKHILTVISSDSFLHSRAGTGLGPSPKLSPL